MKRYFDPTEVRRLCVRTVFSWSRFLDPVSQMSDKVKEEISLWHTDHLQSTNTIRYIRSLQANHVSRNRTLRIKSLGRDIKEDQRL